MNYLYRAARDRALFFIFLFGFLLSLGLACWTGWNSWVSSQQALHQPAQWFGNAGYLWSFALVIFSNISSNLFGQTLVIVLTAYFVYRRSAESRDEEDSVENLVESVYGRVVGPPPPEKKRPGLIGIWQGYSLGILFAAGFLLFLILQTWSGWVAYQAAQSSVRQASSFGGYLVSDWGYNTWQNWQADLLGPAIQVVLAKHFIFRGSSQSKESQERMQTLLKQVAAQLSEGGNAMPQNADSKSTR